MNNNINRKHPPRKTLTRREFLQVAGVAASALLTGCGIEPSAWPKETPAPASTPQGAPSTPAAINVRKAQVAIAREKTYDAQTLYNRLRDMLDSLGGLGDIVRPGARVAIKTNLTGGTYWEGKTWNRPAVDTFVTHPEVVGALGKLVLDAGAKELYIVEAVYQWESYTLWGYEAVAKRLGATLIDLNDTAPYPDFAATPVPGGGKLYNDFIFNHILEEVDTFMSVSKMKCHWVAGVTHTMKNLFGLIPHRFYELNAGDGYRSALHGPNDETAGQRVPPIIVDLVRARPLHFGLVDGIRTTEAGEGPWIEGTKPLRPGVLIAGKDVVATDAVATAAMGFDPAAAAQKMPFVRGLNHLALAHEAGLGVHRLEEIEVLGPAIKDVTTKFRAALG